VFAITSPSRDQQEAGGRAPDGEPSRTPSTKTHRQILDFPKNSSLTIWSPERWFMPPWSLRSPVRWQRERWPPSGSGARQLHANARIQSLGADKHSESPAGDFTALPRPTTLDARLRGHDKVGRRQWREGLAQPFEKAQFAKGKSLDFASVRLGFCFRKAWIFLPSAWIFLPPLRAEGELSGPHGTR
jgi:hypothetical protein